MEAPDLESYASRLGQGDYSERDVDELVLKIADR